MILGSMMASLLSIMNKCETCELGNSNLSTAKLAKLP